MSSFTKQITDAMELKVKDLLPTFTKSPYAWDFSLNNARANKNIFAIIPGQARSTDGTLRTITLEQAFTVKLSTNYINKNGNDLELQAAIEVLYLSLEIVMKEAMQRRFAINRIMNISSVELTEPEIDNQDHTVTIGATFSALYRME